MPSLLGLSMRSQHEVAEPEVRVSQHPDSPQQIAISQGLPLILGLTEKPPGSHEPHTGTCTYPLADTEPQTCVRFCRQARRKWLGFPHVSQAVWGWGVQELTGNTE